VKEPYIFVVQYELLKMKYHL